jgi:hypothetical protein
MPEERSQKARSQKPEMAMGFASVGIFGLQQLKTAPLDAAVSASLPCQKTENQKARNQKAFDSGFWDSGLWLPGW